MAGNRTDRDAARKRILDVVRRVRRRWRLRVGLRAAALMAGAGLAALAVTAWGLELFRFSPGAVTAFRLVAYAGVAIVAVRALLPLLRRVGDEEVALYLEEHEPSLEASVLTAVEAGDRAADDPLVERLVADALARSRAVEFGDRIEREGLWTSSGVLAGVAVAGLFLFLFGPATLRHGATALLFPGRDAAELTPYSIAVFPGDSTVAQGSDPVIRADLRGFRSGDVELLVAGGESDEFETLPMFPSDDGRFEHVLLDLREPARYFVRAAGVRSPTFTLDVAALPYVERMELVYRFPAYTGLEPRTVEDGGDVAVLPGTRVLFRVAPTVATPGGRLVLDDSATVPLTADDEGRLTGELVVEEPGGYRVELERPDGRMGAASPHYTIDLLRDQPPSVRFEEPAADTRASPIEEVFVEALAEDDYGVASLELIYAVNGGAEDTLRLYGGGGSPLREVSAGHTLFLEEWQLVPGDVVSYYAVARDGNRVTGTGEAVSDLFFVTIRPFRKDFSAADSRGMGGGGQGGAAGQSSLVEIQRQIVSATFNLVRDRELRSEAEWRTDVVSVALSQKDLRDEVSRLVAQMETRLRSRGDETFRTVAEELPKAVAAMDSAAARLDAREVREALPPEQTALLHLQRADEAYREVQLSLQQQGGGQGGGGRPPAEDLADLFELELDKLENQYETVQRGGRESADQTLDETLERLKELARRQQQEAERQERRLRGSQQGAPSSGDAQRSLAEETEEAARRLERLSRERGAPELQETARRLREAADAMRRSAASGGRGETAADARRAARELEEARRLLEEARAGRLRDDVERARERARRLRQRQEEVREEVADLEEDRRDPGAVRRLQERKDQMAATLEELEESLDRTAARARGEEAEAARALQEAAGAIREDRVKEKIRFSKGLVERGEPERARAFEGQIAADLDSLVHRLERAREAVGSGSSDPLEEALDEARGLTRGMETLERRLREGGREGGESERGAPREGSPGPRGERGAVARGGPGGGGPPSIGPDAARQLRREFRERADAAERLRRRLDEAGRPTEDVERVLEALRALDDGRVYSDTEEVLRLQAEALRALRRVEFALRRELRGRDGPPIRLPGPDEIPAEFRELVEEYYRSLSEGEGRPGG